MKKLTLVCSAKDEEVESIVKTLTDTLSTWGIDGKVNVEDEAASTALIPLVDSVMVGDEVDAFLQELHKSPALWLHVITKALARPTPKEYIQKREGPKKSLLTYVEGSYAIATLAALSKLGVMSSFDIVQTDVSSESVECLGKLTLKFYVNGSWSECSKMQWGGCLRQPGVPVGSTKKGAATDSLKKCLNAFGWALDVYTTEIEWQVPPSPEDMKAEQIQSFYDRAKEKGMTKEQAREWCKTNANGKTPEELDTKDLSAIKRRLIKAEVPSV
jgi:hypothetical protein